MYVKIMIFRYFIWDRTTGKENIRKYFKSSRETLVVSYILFMAKRDVSSCEASFLGCELEYLCGPLKPWMCFP